MKCTSTLNMYIIWKDRNIVVTQYSPPFVDDELGEVGQGCRDAGSSWLASSAPVKDFYFLSENIFHLFVSTKYPLGFEKEDLGYDVDWMWYH